MTIKNFIHFFFFSLLLIGFPVLLSSQSELSMLVTENSQKEIKLTSLMQQLKSAPDSFTAEKTSSLIVRLPNETGYDIPYYVVESSIMSAELQANYPELKTYAVIGVNDSSFGRLTVSPYGLNAFIQTENGSLGIHPVDINAPLMHYVYVGDTPNELEEDPDMHVCGFENEFDDTINQNIDIPQNNTSTKNQLLPNIIENGSLTRIYRFAAVATAEFTSANGGTVASATAAIVNSVNLTQVIYEKDLAVNFTLLTPFIYTDIANDPFVPDNTGGGCSRTLQAANAVALNFPIADYDIGHAFHNSSVTTGFSGGGVAFLGVICNDNIMGGSCNQGGLGNQSPNIGSFKAGGWSGSFDNTSNGWIRLFAHEVGHMFNMPHTFNGTNPTSPGNCLDNISSTTSYEIGSGTTIMSYRSLCQADNNIPATAGTGDNYFHTNSLERAINRMNSTTCATTTNLNNTPPEVTANPCGTAISIPLNTPFTLTGSGTDANGDNLLYTWEQYDEDGAGTPTQGFIGNTAALSTIAPLFRSYPPQASPSRTFPDMNSILNNANANDFDVLPQVARTINLRLTARDCSVGGGGIGTDDVNLSVDANAGPLVVTSPNGGETLTLGTNTITWAVNNTNSLSSTVNILMSLDGGISFPIILATATSNDGSESVNLPTIPASSTVRIKVEAIVSSCLTFFDISDADFNITSNCTPIASTICNPDDVVAGPGDAATNLTLTNLQGSPISSKSFNVAVGDPTTNVVVASPTGTCQNQGFNKIFGVMEFSVSETGSYTFQELVSGFLIMNIFEGSFDPTDPCPTWVDSNASDPDTSPGGTVNANSVFSVNLTKCTSYFLTIHGYGSVNDFSGDVNLSGVGDIIENGATNSDYGYTYIAINTANNQIAAVDAGADFTSLAAGTYTVSGLSYYSGAGPSPAMTDLSTFVGQTFNDLITAGNCFLQSTNSLSLNLTSTCPPNDCDDNDCTTTDSYNTTTCLCEFTPITPPTCDDNDCTTDDSFNTTTCLCEFTPITPPTCDDNDCTTDDSFNTTTCLCEFTPITPPTCDDNDCTTDDSFNTTTCLCEFTPITPPTCDDNDCTTDDSFNTTTCLCEFTPITPPTCDDNDCTTDDSFNTTTCLCEFTPITPPTCDDNDCTTDDSFNTTTCLCEFTPITPPTCDDNDCTTDDSFNTTTCLCEFTPITPPTCDDNDCSTDDSFNTTTCLCEFTPITPPTCDDNDCTTDDSFNTTTCLCEFTPITPPTCDDNDCTTDDSFNTTTCLCEFTPITPPTCDDNDCSTDDSFNTTTCLCEFTPITPPTCDDNDCTTDDSFNTTTCLCEFTPITPPNCDDGNCATVDVYNTTNCMCENNPITPNSCDDNDCTTDDSYNTTTCMCEFTPITPPTCDDNDCTTDDSFNTTTCLCEFTPITPPTCDDNDCTTDDSFNTTTCLCEFTPITPPNCDDGNCATVDVYNTTNCMCENNPITPNSCDDNDCTTDDSYNTTTCMCEFTPITPPTCDDNDCTTDDSFNTTTCLCEFTPITPPTCDDNDCTTDDSFNTTTCLCEFTPITPPNCDDGNCATVDVYNTTNCMCENNPITPNSCDDNDCTTDDSYNTTTCMCEFTPITPPTCDDNDCTTDDSFNTTTCLCEFTPITPPTCDDNDCTTDDSFNTTTCLCEFTPITPPTCDDNDCTTDDSFNTTTCLCEFTPITPPTCDDNDCTTDDSFNTTTCLCEFTPITPPTCDDNDCTTDDSFNTTTCLCEFTPITPPTCDDNDCTTDDSFNTTTCLCEFTPITPPTCDDNDCTTDDSFNTTTCLCEFTPITPPTCDDNDCTTDDSFNTTTCLCEFTPITPPTCDDNDCTTDDSFNTTTCLCEFTPITPPTCDDNDCTTDDSFNTTTCLCENVAITSPPCLCPSLVDVFINEIHYDNTGGDTGEFIEIAILNSATVTLADLTISLYDGSTGTIYDSETLDNFIEGMSDGTYTFYTWNPAIIQDGSPDGVSLDCVGTVLQFLSYEGSFIANDGPANGTNSTDIGTNEPDDAPTGSSIQLIDGIWTYTPNSNSAGNVNMPCLDPTFTPSFTQPTCMLAGEITFSDADLDFEFSINGGAFATAMSPILLSQGEQAAATYEIQATDANGCTSIETVNVAAIIDCQSATGPVIECRQPTSTCNEMDMCGNGNINLLPPFVLEEGAGGIIITNDAPDFFPIGTTIVSWTVTDAMGNFANCTSLVIITDEQEPAINMGNTLSVFTNNGCTADVVISPNISDNCSVLSTTGTGTFNFPNGVSTHTITATDGVNETIHTVMVYVHDGEAPFADFCPEDFVTNDASGDFDLPTPIFSDNCAVFSIENDAPTNLPQGTTTVTWEAMDNYGNIGTCIYNVTIQGGNEFVSNPDSDNAARADERTSDINSESVFVLSLSPNPANSFLSINYELSKGEKATIMIYDATGQAMSQLSIKGAKASAIFDTSSFRDGIYLVELKLENGKRKVMKFAVQH